MVKTVCSSPLGDIILASDGEALCGLWFAGQKHEGAGLPESCPTVPLTALPVFRETAAWLDAYFAGRSPCRAVPLRLNGTAFQTRVWLALRDIPYGETRSYGELAAAVGCRSARAVGAAVGRNPISLLVPCHRVVGADGSLTGYAGGIERKRRLLMLEQTGVLPDK